MKVTLLVLVLVAAVIITAAEARSVQMEDHQLNTEVREVSKDDLKTYLQMMRQAFQPINELVEDSMKELAEMKKSKDDQSLKKMIVMIFGDVRKLGHRAFQRFEELNNRLWFSLQ